MIIYIECVINRTPLGLLSLTFQPRNRVIFVYFYGQMMSSVVMMTLFLFLSNVNYIPYHACYNEC
jgi:hypothetical protein